MDWGDSDFDWFPVAYLESNGMDGLQRKDTIVDNTVCTGGEPDTLIWCDVAIGR